MYAQLGEMSVRFNPLPNTTVVETAPSNTVTVPITFSAMPFYDCDVVTLWYGLCYVTCTLTEINNSSNTFTFQVKPDDNGGYWDDYAFTYVFGCTYNPTYPSSGTTSFSFSIPANISSGQYLLSLSISVVQCPVSTQFGSIFSFTGIDLTTSIENTCVCYSTNTAACEQGSSSFPCELPNILQINIPDVFDLYMKNTNDDLGCEPFEGTGNIWQSPDLINKRTYYDPATVSMTEEGVLYGTDTNYMYVKIRNRGNIDYLATDSGMVELYWTRARTGEPWPIHWDATEPANQVNNYPQGGLIATVPVNQDILTGQDKVIYSAWTPPAPSTLTSSVSTFSNGLPMICYLARFVHPDDPMAYETSGDITPHIKENNNVVTRNSWIESISKFPKLPYAGPVFWLTADRTMSTSLVFEPIIEPDSSTFNDWGEISIYLHEDIFDQWLKDGSYGTGFTINTKERKLTLTGNSAIIDSIMLVQGDDYPVMVTYTLKKFANPLENYHYEYIIRSYNRTDSTETGGFHFDVTVKPPVNFLCEITETINATNPKTCDGSATVTGFGGTPPYTYQWSRSAGNQTTPTAVGLCIGTHTVIVTDSVGAADTASVTIFAINKKNLIIDNSEDIQPIEQKIDNYISIYPNPSKGVINVDYSVPDGISSTLVFYDVNGRKISSYNLESNSKRICLNDETIFSEGVYYYSLIIGNEVVTRDKLVIIK